MFAPLNGASLNGSAAGLWVTAEASASAEASAQNRVYSAASATATVTAQTSSTSVRRTFFEGGKLASSAVSLQATRLANFDGVSQGEAAAPIQPVRTAWFDASAIACEAASTSTLVRLTGVDTSIFGEGQGQLNDAALTVFRGAVSKRRPAQGTTWIAEDRIEEIQVHQVYTTADAGGRARTRALANTALGFSVLEPNAQVTTDPLWVSTIHAFSGSAEADLEAIADPLRIRIIEGGTPCVAEARAAPTITTASGRYSYNSGTAEAIAPLTEGVTKVYRSLPAAQTNAQAAVGPSQTFLRRGVRGSLTAEAASVATPDSFSWVMPTSVAVQGTSETTGNCTVSTHGSSSTSGQAVTSLDGFVVRSLEAVAEGQSQATSTSIRAAHLDGESQGEAADNVVPIRTAYLGGTTEAQATPSLVGSRRAYLTGDPADNVAETSAANNRTAVMLPISTGGESTTTSINSRSTQGSSAPSDRVGSASVESNVYILRFLDNQTLVGEADEAAQGLRIMNATATQQAIASTLELNYRINVDALAPDDRTVLLAGTLRELRVPAPDREYRVA